MDSCYRLFLMSDICRPSPANHQNPINVLGPAPFRQSSSWSGQSEPPSNRGGANALTQHIQLLLLLMWTGLWQ